MAVTRRVHVVKPRIKFNAQLPAADNGQMAQVYIDPAVNALLDTLTPAERIVGVMPIITSEASYVYIFTESFGLGPAKKVP